MKGSLKTKQPGGVIYLDLWLLSMRPFTKMHVNCYDSYPLATLRSSTRVAWPLQQSDFEFAVLEAFGMCFLRGWVLEVDAAQPLEVTPQV